MKQSKDQTDDDSVLGRDCDCDCNRFCECDEMSKYLCVVTCATCCVNVLAALCQ